MEKFSQEFLSLPFNYHCWYGSVDLCFGSFCLLWRLLELGAGSLCLSHSELACLQRQWLAFLISRTAYPSPSAEQRIFSHESYWFPSIFSLCWERKVSRFRLGTNPRQWVHSRPWIWEALCWSILIGGIDRNVEGWPLGAKMPAGISEHSIREEIQLKRGLKEELCGYLAVGWGPHTKMVMWITPRCSCMMWR